MTALVGLYSPFPRSGKSTFARELERLVPGARVLKFADSMREVVAPLAGHFFQGGEAEVHYWLDSNRKDTEVIPGLGVTLRHCLQTLGTQWGRNLIHPDLWVKIMQQRIRRACTAPLIVVDDVRFENEYHMLRKESAWLVRIERPDGPETPAHESNARLDGLPFDYTIYNSGDMNDLRLKALAVAWDLGVT